MIRISIPFFYGLGAAMRSLADIKPPGQKLLSAITAMLKEIPAPPTSSSVVVAKP